MATHLKALMKYLFTLRAETSNHTGVHHAAESVILEQDGTGGILCTTGIEGKHCQTSLATGHIPHSRDCQSDHPQILASLCQLIDSSNLDHDEEELRRRNLITPPNQDSTSTEPPRTRDPPKITSKSSTHDIITLTELPDPSSTHSGETVHITAHPPVITSFITVASSSTSADSSSASNSSIPQGADPNYSVDLSTGSKVSIAIGCVFLCGVLWITLRCCFKHRGKWNHEEDPKSSQYTGLISRIPEKKGSPINEIDGRVTVHPPGPVDGICELDGDPVDAPYPKISEAPKFPATGTRENNIKGKAPMVNTNMDEHLMR